MHGRKFVHVHKHSSKSPALLISKSLDMLKTVLFSRVFKLHTKAQAELCKDLLILHWCYFEVVESLKKKKNTTLFFNTDQPLHGQPQSD